MRKNRPRLIKTQVETIIELYKRSIPPAILARHYDVSVAAIIYHTRPHKKYSLETIIHQLEEAA